jgi:ribosomal protein S18 acetylase RimI-like enzyme
VARRGERIVGTLAAAAPGRDDVPRVIDHISDLGVTAAECADFNTLTARATADLVPLGCEIVSIFSSPDVGFDAPAAASLTAAFRNCGWEPQAAMRHYETEVRRGLGDGISSELRLEQVVRADDQRLVRVYPQVFAQSLDQGHREAQQRIGFEAAWHQELDRLLADDPVECIRLAFDFAGRCVGIVTGRVVGGGVAYVMFVGVAQSVRGRGYGRQLLAAMTGELVAQGATKLIGDTDYGNAPMGKAFADVGWVQTESRMDLSRQTGDTADQPRRG